MNLLSRRPRRTRERIHLVSWAGFPNYGDELITARWLRFLARHRPEAEVHLDTRFPGITAALFAGMHPHLVATDAVFRALDAVLRYERRTIGELVRDLGTPHFDLLLEDLRAADTVHVLGGGWQNSRWADNALVLDALRAVAEHSGARLLATGQGLMPAGPASFDGFDHVSVRDLPSAEHLGIERGYDDAYLLGASAPRTRRRISAEVEEVVLCIQDDLQDAGAFDRNVAYAREAVRALGIPRERVRYVEAIPGTDHPGYAAPSDLVAEDGFLPTDHQADIEEIVAGRIMLEDLFRALDELDPDGRLMCELFSQGMSEREMTQVFGVSRPVIHKRLTRLFEHLRKILEK